MGARPTSAMARRLQLLLARQEEMEVHVGRLRQLGGGGGGGEEVPGEGSRFVVEDGDYGRAGGDAGEGENEGGEGDGGGGCDDGGQAVGGELQQLLPLWESSLKRVRKSEGGARRGGVKGSEVRDGSRQRRVAAAVSGRSAGKSKSTREVAREEEGSSDSPSLLLQDLTTELFLK